MYVNNDDMEFLVKLENALCDDIMYNQEHKKLQRLNQKLAKRKETNNQRAKDKAAKERAYLTNKISKKEYQKGQ